MSNLLFLPPNYSEKLYKYDVYELFNFTSKYGIYNLSMEQNCKKYYFIFVWMSRMPQF
jgi:hypothetical protein